MPPIPPQPVQLTCPACGTPFRAAIYTVIDVGQQPELKNALLSGQVNLAICPNCQTASMLGAPLLYHDPAKQLCLVYVPPELSASPQEQERFVGEATNFIMRALPPDAPKGYLLTPRRFISLGSLVDAIFEADGVSREVLEAQRKRVDLISQFADALEDDERFAALIAQHRAELNSELFATIAAFINASPPEQHEARALLEQVDERLRAESGFVDDDFGDEVDIEAAIERLAAVSDDELELAVAELRHVIDYSFFQRWTERLEQLAAEGQAAESTRLSERRARILSLVEEMDRQAQAMFDAGNAVLREVLEAEDLRAALESRVDKLDEAFMLVLSANLAAAQRTGEGELVARLEEIGKLAVEIVQAHLSPEERFINDLLMAETPQESTRLLRKNVTMITPDLVKQLNELAEHEEKRANQPVAERLRQLAREAGAMLF